MLVFTNNTKMVANIAGAYSGVKQLFFVPQMSNLSLVTSNE